MKNRPLAVAAACLAVALILSTFSISKRYRVQSSNRAVALTAESEVVQSLAAGQQIGLSEALADLKAQGLNSLVLTEQTLGQLVADGRVQWVTASTAEGGAIAETLTFQDKATLDRTTMGLRIRFGALAGNLDARGLVLSLPPLPLGELRRTSMGIDPAVAALAKSQGLWIIARMANPTGISSNAVSQTVAWAKSMGASAFLPLGSEVLGRRKGQPTLIASLRSQDMAYLTPEFGKIAGDSTIVASAPDIVIRLHSALPAEIDKMTSAAVVERYVRAARERGIRVLLLRPISPASSEPVQSFGDFIRTVDHTLTDYGMAIAAPRPYKQPGVSRFVFIGIGLFLAPVLALVFSELTKLKRSMQPALLIAILAGLSSAVQSGRQADALLIAVALPVAGYLFLARSAPRGILESFLIWSAISLIGGLCIAGLLNGLPFYIEAAEFKAIKVAVVLPLLVIGWRSFADVGDWKSALRTPVALGGALLGTLCLIAVVVLIARTGNDTGIGASGPELFVRNLLARTLFVRPRTKEFLIGHPFLVVALGFWRRFRGAPPGRGSVSGGWLALLITIGAIGQVSIVNTLCHIHIPIQISLARIAEGMVIGSIIGFGAWSLVGKMMPNREDQIRVG